MSGEITKEAVALMRRAAEITGNEEIKFAAAHIQSEYDKKHPRQAQGQAQNAPLEKPIKNPLARSISAPDASFYEARKKKATQHYETIQSQLPRKKWTPQSYHTYLPPPTYEPKIYSKPAESATSLPITKLEAAQLQSIADRTKNLELKALSRKLQHIAVAPSAPIHNTRIASKETASTAKSESIELKDQALSQTVASTTRVDEYGQAGIPPSITCNNDSSGSLLPDSAAIPICHVSKVEESQLQTSTDRPGDVELKEFSKEVHSTAAESPLSAGVGAS